MTLAPNVTQVFSVFHTPKIIDMQIHIKSDNVVENSFHHKTFLSQVMFYNVNLEPVISLSQKQSQCIVNADYIS